MNFVPKLSLQNIASVKIVTALRIQDDINCIMASRAYRTSYPHEVPTAPQLRAVGERVHEKLIKLHLPKFLERKIFTVAKHMTYNAMLWIIRHCVPAFQKIFKCKIDYPCFTSDGVVDNKKTVEMIIRNGDLDIKERYALACWYCLQSDIRKLCNKLSTAEKEYLDKMYTVRNPISSYPMNYWIFPDNIKTGCTPEMFWECSFALSWTKETTEYTLQKLTPSGREQSMIMKIKDIANDPYFDSDFGNYEIFFFLLTKISDWKQIEICQTFPFVVLVLLLHWPRPYLFLRTAQRLWNFLPSDKYVALSKKIIQEVSKDNNSDYKELFREFWLESPMTHKKSFYDKCESRMDNVLKIEDENKNKRLRKGTAHEYILNLIKNDEWNALELLFSSI